MKLRNRAALSYALMAGREALPGVGPLEVVLEVTTRCNLRCPMCARTLRCPDRPRQDMSLETFRRIAANLWPGTERVALAGLGEPILNPALREMVELLVREGFPVALYTNASRMSREVSRALLGAGLSAVVFPMDGHSAATYERHRVGACFNAVRDNILSFLEERDALGSDCHVEVQMLKLPGTEDEIDGFRRFWSRAGADAVRYKADHMTDLGRTTAQRGVCPMPWRGPATIDVAGRVFPCCVQDERNAILGNAAETPVQELWDGALARSLRRAFVKGRRKLPTCRGCDVPLPPRPLAAGGTLVSPFTARRVLTVGEYVLGEVERRRRRK